MDKNKQKALIERTIEKLNKKNKNGILSTLASAHEPENEKIFAPTNNLALDYVIGRPGFPAGRISEIAGEFSSGKCLVSGTKVLTDKGLLKNIEDVHVGDELISPMLHKHEQSNVYYSTDRVMKVTDSGVQPVLRLTLANGMTIEATGSHPFLAVKKDRSQQELPFFAAEPWVKLSDLRVGDAVAVPEYAVSNMLYNDLKFQGLSATTIFSPDEMALQKELVSAKLLQAETEPGYSLFSEIEHLNRNTIIFSFISFLLNSNKTKFAFERDRGRAWLSYTSTNLEFLQQLQQFFMFNCSVNFYIKSSANGRYSLNLDSVSQIYSLVTIYTFGDVPEQYQEFYAFARDSRTDNLAMTKSQSLSEKPAFFRSLFLNVIKSRISFKFITEMKDFGQVRAAQTYDNIKKYLYPQLRPENKYGVLNNSRTLMRVDNFDATDKYHYDMLFRALQWLPIVAIEAIGEKQTWDLTMQNRPYFIANGMVVHNSTIAAMTLGQAQKAGMVTILVDTELSYSPDWAMRYGVDPSLLILMQPTHLEQTFDELRMMIDDLCENKDPDESMLCIVDSVSATPTSAEVAQEDSTAGKQRADHAKVLASSLRTITQKLSQANMALVFISQVKDNPGMMYGGGKSKLGGSAIDYHAGLLVRTKIVARKKQNEIPIGQIVQVSTQKNKFVPPFRRANFEISYVNGVDNRLTAVEFLINMGKFKKKAGWVELEDGSKKRPNELVDLITPQKLSELYDYLGITNVANVDNGNRLAYGEVSSDEEIE